MNNMKGFYVVKENGVEVGRYDNIVTTAGKQLMAKFAAGTVNKWAGAICVGAIGATATAADTRLGFEWGRAPITSSAVNLYGGPTGGSYGVSGAHRLIFKATLDQNISGKIYEFGMYPDITNSGAGVGQSSLLSIADSSNPWKEYNGSAWIDLTSTPDTVNDRIGEDMVNLTATGTTKRYRLTGMALDMSAYSNLDQISFAFNNATNNPTSIAIQFVTDDSNYYSKSVTGTWLGATGTYKANTLTKADFVATGVPSWSNITSIEFSVLAGSVANFYLDGIRIEDMDTPNPDYVLVSHSIPSTPLTKSYGSLMDLEYYLDMGS